MLPSKNSVQNSPITAGRDVRIGDSYFLFGHQTFALCGQNKLLKKINGNLFDADLPFFENQKAEALAFFSQFEKRVLRIVGPNESGKSHLLRSAILSIGDLETHGVENPHMNGSLPEIRRDGPLALVIEDAEFVDVPILEAVFRFIHDNPEARLLLTCTPAFEKDFDRFAAPLKGFSGLTKTLRLENWSHERLVDLLRLAAGAEKVENEQAIARKFGNPYLMKIYGEALAGKREIDLPAVQRDFVQKLERTAQMAFDDLLDAPRIADLLLCFSFSPLADDALEQIEMAFSIQKGSLQIIFERLERIGLIRKRHERWAIFPPVKAEFYLASRLDFLKTATETEAFARAFLQNAEARGFERIVASAQYVEEKGRIAAALSKILNEWENEARTEPKTAHHGRLKAAFSALRFPEFQKEKGCLESVCRFGESCFFNIESFDKDLLGEFLLELLPFFEVRKTLLQLLGELQKAKNQPHYSNRKPEYIVEQAFLPIPQRNDEQTQSLNFQFARAWFFSGDERLQKLAATALRTVLADGFEWTWSSGEAMHFQNHAFPFEPLVIDAREKALILAFKVHERPETELLSIRILREIGRGKLYLEPEKMEKHPLFERIVEELDRSTERLGQLFFKTESLSSKLEIEAALFNWWLNERPVSAEKWLLKFPRALDFLVIQQLADMNHRRVYFSELQKMAPKKGRYKWFYDHKMHLDRERVFDPLVQKLAAEFSTAEETSGSTIFEPRRSKPPSSPRFFGRPKARHPVRRVRRASKIDLPF